MRNAWGKRIDPTRRIATAHPATFRNLLSESIFNAPAVICFQFLGAMPPFGTRRRRASRIVCVYSAWCCSLPEDHRNGGRKIASHLLLFLLLFLQGSLAPERARDARSCFDANADDGQLETATEGMRLHSKNANKMPT